MNIGPDSRAGRFTKLEKDWILYDVANSAITLLFTTLLPLYFNSVADSAGLDDAAYLAYWGYAVSICTAIVAVLGPILGTVADRQGMKKRLFLLTIGAGALGLALLAIPQGWISFLLLFVLSRVGYQASLIFYDAMLTDVTTHERMDKVSSYGFALGYIGSVIPFILSLVIVLSADRIGLSGQAAMSIAIMLNLVWWLALTVPLARNYRQKYYVTGREQGATRVFTRLWNTLKEIRSDRKIFFFLIAFFFYIDGVSTIINMAVAYGSSIGLDSTALLLALLVTQIVAFPSAIIYGHLARRLSNHFMITVGIVAYTLITVFAVQLDREWEFWFLAVMVGLFQGGIQALSRSYYGQLIPREKSGEYFGIYDIFSKGASFTGTFLVAFISQRTGEQSNGIAALVVIFILGLYFFRKAVRIPAVPRL